MGTLIDALRATSDVLAELSLPVKMAWGGWLVWSVGLAAWLRGWRPRVSVPAFKRAAAAPPPPPASPLPPAVRTVSKSSVRRPAARPSAVKRPVSPYGQSDFLAVLDEEQLTGNQAGKR